ncbi:MAG: GDSL-type esterase/lipase family protein [Pseudomonadota bacterium]
MPLRRALVTLTLALPLHAGAATVFLVGDSTMAPNTGYGDALCQRLTPALDCVNLGRGGRSTKSYRAEGLWDVLLARLKSGSGPAHVLIQFGHNDQPGKAERTTNLATEYPANLARYVSEVRAAGATPVLVTPLARRTFDGPRLTDGLQPWSEAMRRVARAHNVPLIDLHALSMAAVQPLGQAGADDLAEAPPGDRRFDRTHLGELGACVFAEIMSRELTRQVGALATPRRSMPDCATLLPPTLRFSRGTADTRGWTATTGGAGGQIIRVTTLAASGPGSLKAAIETPGPRTVVFEVGGVIDMAGAALDIRHPHLTIAGQTAPSPGVTVIKAETVVRTHDVIVQHLRFRPGEFGRPKKGGGDQDGLSTVGGAHDVIVDHCSFSWATDENLSASGPRFAGDTPEDWRRGTSHRITYSHNLLYEGLSNSVHASGEHSKGSLIHDNTSAVLLYANVYVSNRERNALFKGGAQGAMVNNLIFNPGRRAVHYNLWPQEWTGKPWQAGRLSLVGNTLRHGPDTEPGTAFFTLRGAGEVFVHLADNVAINRAAQGVPMVDDQSQGQATLRPLAQAELPASLRVRPATLLVDELPGAVGARPWDRDALDARLLAEMAAGRGRIIDSERDNPLGFPAPSEPTRRPFDPDGWNLDDMSPKAGWASLFNPLPGRFP